MPTKDKKSEEEKVEKKEGEGEEEAQEQPKAGISSFSLLDTPKLNVEEISEEAEEEENPSEPKMDTTPAGDEKEKEMEGETPSAGTGEESEPPTAESATETEKNPLSSSEDVKKWLKDIRPDTTQEVQKSGGPNTKLILLILLFLLIVGAVVGGVFYYKSRVSTTQPQEEQAQMMEPTATPTSTPEATPGVQLDLTKYAVSILNGSGVVGEAGKVETTLKSAGFENITKGNAESYDFTATTVSLKKDVPEAVFQKINDALSDSYTVERQETTLSETSSYDVVIVVGTKK